MWNDTDEWWWQTFGADGFFDIWDFINVILYIEADKVASLDPEDQGYKDYKEGLVRDAHGWCREAVAGKPEQCDASTPEGALNWLAAYSQSGASRYWKYKKGASLGDAFPKPDGDYPTALALEIVDAIRSPGNWNGWAGDRPYGPGNASMFGGMTDLRLRKALKLKLATKVLGGDDPVIIPTGCGAFYLTNQESLWKSNGCGSWPGEP